MALQPGAPQDVGRPKLVGVVISNWAQERSHVALKGLKPGHALHRRIVSQHAGSRSFGR